MLYNIKSFFHKNQKILVSILILLTLTGILFNVLTFHKSRTYTSDDVALNVLIAQQEFSTNSELHTSPGPFLLKYPLFAITNHFLGDGRRTLLAINVFQITACYIFMLAALRLITKNKQLKAYYYLPITAMFISSPALYELLLNPTSRSPLCETKR